MFDDCRTAACRSGTMLERMRHRSSTTVLGDDAGGSDARSAADGEKDLDVLHFTYFVVRLQHAPRAARPIELCGVVERLASGEKCGFRNAAELFRLLDSWAHGSEVARGPKTG
jgi:hypothetical protein